VNSLLIYYCDNDPNVPDPMPFCARERAFPALKNNKFIAKYDHVAKVSRLEWEIKELKKKIQDGTHQELRNWLHNNQTIKNGSNFLLYLFLIIHFLKTMISIAI
jgi:hypothetical protein